MIHTEGRRCEDTGRHASLGQGGALEETNPGNLNCSLLGLQICEKINFCCLNSPVAPLVN